MSQKDGTFQPKSKKFGAKPGGKSGGKPGSKFGASKGRPGGKPAGRSGGGFGKRFEGDRPPRRDGDGEGARARKPYGDRPPRRDSDSFGERRPRREGEGERRPYGDRPPRRDGDSRGGRPFGDRPPRRDGDSRGGKPYGDRPPRREGDGERRPYGDRPPRRDGDSRGGKPFGDRPPRREGDGERRPYGDRPPRRDGDSRGGKSFGDRKPRRDDDRGGKSFGDRKPRRDDSRGGKSFSSRDDRTPRYERFDEAPREASEDTRRRLKSDRPGFGAPSPLFLYGLHAVRAALTSEDRKIRRLLVTESGFANIREAYDEARAAGLLRPEPMVVDKEDIDRLLPRDAVHQDVLLDVEPLEDVFLQDLLIAASDNARVIILDQVTDPHNVGAILRSAAFFGADAVIVQKLHAPDVTGTLAKAASGAVEFVPIVREVNLARAIEQLKEAFFTCIGLDERGTLTMAQAAKQSGKGRVAIVMGAEGDGLRRLVAEKCDVLAQLPTEGPLESLNVSNATAVALYELARETE